VTNKLKATQNLAANFNIVKMLLSLSPAGNTK